MSKQLYHGKISGITFEPAKSNFRLLINKFESLPTDKIEFDLRLMEEPDNIYDPNAVLVMLCNKGDEPLKIGYVAKPQNIAVLEHGLDNVKIEITNFNKMQGEIRGIDIMISTRE